MNTFFLNGVPLELASTTITIGCTLTGFTTQDITKGKLVSVHKICTLYDDCDVSHSTEL